MIIKVRCLTEHGFIATPLQFHPFGRRFDQVVPDQVGFIVIYLITIMTIMIIVIIFIIVIVYLLWPEHSGADETP